VSTLLARQWKHYRESFEVETVLAACRPVSVAVPVLFWIAAILVFRFVPEVNRVVGLKEIAAPIAITLAAGATAILSWLVGSRRPNVMAALQLVEVACFAAAVLSVAAASEPPVSYVVCGFFTVSCFYWGLIYSFSLVGVLPLASSVAFALARGGADPFCGVIVGIGFLFFFTVGRFTTHRRRHRAHVLRSEDVLSRIESMFGCCRSDVVTEMRTRAASLAHRVRNDLHNAAEGIRQRDWAVADSARGALVLKDLERAVDALDAFLDDLHSRALNTPSFRLPMLASQVETADPDDDDRLEWSDVPDVWVSGQEGLVAQSLQSLLDNAMEAGAGRVRIDMDADPEKVVITIADDGPGLPEEVHNKLFSPYNTFGKQNGVGLGLFLAAQVFNSAGGGFELISTGPRGTRFKATLPLAVPPRDRRSGPLAHLPPSVVGDV